MRDFDPERADLCQSFQDRLGQLPLTVNPLRVQWYQGDLKLFEEIEGSRTRLWNADRSKEVPPDVGFKQPGKKPGIGSRIASCLRHHLRPLKHILVFHMRHVHAKRMRELSLVSLFNLTTLLTMFVLELVCQDPPLM